jgi:hypothetical protein
MGAGRTAEGRRLAAAGEVDAVRHDQRLGTRYRFQEHQRRDEIEKKPDVMRNVDSGSKVAFDANGELGTWNDAYVRWSSVAILWFSPVSILCIVQ